MKKQNAFSRRSFLELMAAAPIVSGLGARAALAAGKKHIPVGLELYSVRDELDKDLMGTVRRVAKMGYQCVEFYSPYYQWTPAYAKQVRKLLDDLHIKTYSTHNDSVSFSPEGMGKAMELNHILGTRYIVLASPGKVTTIDGWKRVAEMLNKANVTLMRHGFHAGYHNDDDEWKPIGGTKPIDVVASQTEKKVILELDTGNCMQSGGDPVAFIKQHPGRIHAMHVKDYSPTLGTKCLIGDGIGKWKQIFHAAETLGGIEFYLIEQEGYKYPEFKTAEMDLADFRKVYR
jgi:sugar phosphate isomerase/epimerase